MALTLNLFTPLVYADNTTIDSIGSVNGEDDGVKVGVDTTQEQQTTYNDETTEPINGEGTQDTYVYVSQASTFSVTIPKIIVLGGKKDDNGLNKGAYVVSVSGNFGGEETINIVPEDSVTLKQLGKNDISATITQEKESWAFDEVDVIGNGLISTNEMSAGSWSGSFVFNIGLISPNTTKSYAYYENGEGVWTWEELLENTELGVLDDGTLTSDNGTGSYSSSRTNLQALTGEIVIDDSVTNIGSYTFYRCTNLTSVTIPDSVTSIKNDTFYSCTNLNSITIGESVTTIGNNAFSNCDGLTSVTIPNSVTTIGNNAFSGCKGLTSITIPNSITTIEDFTFYNCTGLTSVTIPDSVTAIGNHTFNGCANLNNVTIPDSVTTIGNYVFSDCTSLSNVTIGSSVTSMGQCAFSSCTTLTNITIPNSVTSIGIYAFNGCTGLTRVTFKNASGWYITNTKGATSGTSLTLTNTSSNATYLKSTYFYYYWYRK